MSFGGRANSPSPAGEPKCSLISPSRGRGRGKNNGREGKDGERRKGREGIKEGEGMEGKLRTYKSFQKSAL